MLLLKITERENVEPCEQYLLERNVSIDEAKLFDEYQNVFEFVQKKHQPNAIYCKMMGHKRWAKYFKIFNTIECPFKSRVRHFFCKSLQRYNSPAN